MSVKNYISMILKPTRCCMRNVRFKVRDCMRNARFEVRDCMKKVRFEVRLHEKCAVRSTINLMLQIVLRTAQLSCSRTSNRTFFMQSHTSNRPFLMQSRTLNRTFLMQHLDGLKITQDILEKRSPFIDSLFFVGGRPSLKMTLSAGMEVPCTVRYFLASSVMIE